MVKALLAIYAIWGFNWVVMKEANVFFPPVTFAFLRFLSGAVVLLLVSFYLHLPVPPKRYWPWIAATGFLQIAFNNTAAQVGMVTLGAGMASILDYTMPIWLAVMAHFILKERLTKRKILGILISMAGLCLLLNVDVSGGNLFGIGLTVLGAIGWAAAGIIVKIQDRHMKNKDCTMIQYTTWQMVAGAAALGLYTAITGLGTIQWTPLAAACLAYNGILASSLAFFLWNIVLTRMEAAKAGVASLAVPAVGVICGILFLGEPLTLQMALGMVLVLAGILCIMVQKGITPTQQTGPGSEA